jgi:Protein of unknown function (DUF3611)
MAENYDLARSLPNNVEKASSILQRAGTIGFWAQIVLGVISAVTTLFASTALFNNQDSTSNVGLGVFFAFFSLVLLGIAIFFCFRYSKMAQKLRYSDPNLRPKKTDTLQVIKIGLIINLGGMMLAILGAATLSGIVLFKSLTIPQGTLTNNPKQFVTSIDLVIIQANTNTIMAHFAGIVNSLWLLNRIAK